MHDVIGAIQELFRDLGILCHPHKCELEPTPQLDFLGIRLNIPEARFYLTAKQLEKLHTKSMALLATARK